MTKVIYVPLDERPCNYDYPQTLAAMTDLEMLLPSRGMLGDMKKPAQTKSIVNWLKSIATEAKYAIVSIDMLLYGGIVPSRLHNHSVEECLARLHSLKELKKLNPSLQIFAYDLIMRVPAYSSSEEEPDYYEQYGAEIHRLGWLSDKREQLLATDGENTELDELKKDIPDHILNDYFKRRNQNAQLTKKVLEMVELEEIDYLIIPLDDNAEYGFSAMEQRQLTYEIEKRNIADRVAVYPGADEIACTLFARVFCEANLYTPEIALRYSSINGPFVIPRYEDRSLGESIKSHITAAGGVIIHNEKENDFLLMVHSPADTPKTMAESSFSYDKRHRSYFSEVNNREFIQVMKHFVAKGVRVALADVAICNGADHSLLKQVKKQGMLESLIAYAGWNTNGNTMGTVVAHAIISSYYRTNPINKPVEYERNDRTFFYSRLVEDWGYQSVVRKYVSYEVLPTLGLTPRFLEEQVVDITSLVEKELNEFIEEYLSDLSEGYIQLKNVYLPWRRMFEIGFSLNYSKTGLFAQPKSKESRG
ncbi:DUF4127 family protein [Alkalihalobacillus sp. 1P02AB]|uniref:DUF4127 family protein n=1 Tax=Alkalihalobacillus sp. 1P02AB TaxID=3132260 RepID=UPI0039A4C5FF